jgi:hypothetical protein
MIIVHHENFSMKVLIIEMSIRYLKEVIKGHSKTDISAMLNAQAAGDSRRHRVHVSM